MCMKVIGSRRRPFSDTSRVTSLCHGSRSFSRPSCFAWDDDYSRRILHAEYFWDEKLPRMEKTFGTVILRWGIPKKCYLDNGHVYIAAHFALVLAQLGIKKIHHGPYKSLVKGKIVGDENDQTGFPGQGTAGRVQDA